MTAVAQVVVDVPTQQTDRPFDYAIPEALVELVKPGMRVLVPFGHRDVSGMVVALEPAETFDGELKPIADLIDYVPVLNPELLALSRWLAQHTFAFWISCIQTMLPAMLKLATDKWVVPTDTSSEATLALLGPSRQLNLSTLTDDVQKHQLITLVAQKQLAVAYQPKDKATVRTQTLIEPLLSVSAYQELTTSVRKNATQQLQLLELLSQWATAKKQVLLPEVLAQTELTRATITAAAKKGWLNLIKQEVYRAPYPELDASQLTQPLALTAEQQQVVDAISQAVVAEAATPFLIEGVTGSGKTEVYLQIMAQALQKGRTALMLVPEIALTPQMVNRVKGRFGKAVAVLHSGLSDGEKYDEWRRIDRNEAQIVVGARSAVFAPLDNIGVIIIDEEHESSYKQDDAPRYHARDVAMQRAATHHAPVVLGSATPSLESRARAQKGVYTLMRLPHRVHQQPLPPVHVIDMTTAYQQGGQEDFSAPLLDALRLRLEKKEQSVLMLNRRGFSSFVMCRDCGFVSRCPNCDISLTLHMDSHSLKCHYCGHEEAVPSTCPSCGSRKIRYYGTGTQKVEANLQKLLPQARIIRMDVDTTRKKGAHGKLLRRFGNHEADILLGTQMIAKGLDFPDVTLVGVINADTGLGLPDFRASERTFQLLTQVAGRAGRADKPGEVFIQSFNPDHYAIQLAKHHDYESFFRQEMAIRHRGDYPPYYFTTKVTVSHPDEMQAAKLIFQVAKFIQTQLPEDAIMLGPTPASIARIKNRYLYQFVVKYKQAPLLQAALQQVLTTTQKSTRNGFYIAIDAEPQNFV